MEKRIDIGLLLLRVAIGFPMLIYGISKLIRGIEFIKELLVAAGLPSFIAYGVYVGEIIAPLALLVGFRVRFAGLLFGFNCLTALLLTQTDAIFRLNAYGGWAIELLVIYLLVSLALFFTGGGKFSISSSNYWD